MDEIHEPWDQSRENLKLYFMVLDISIVFIILIGVVSSFGGSGEPRLVGLILLAIEMMVWYWLTGKNWRCARSRG